MAGGPIWEQGRERGYGTVNGIDAAATNQIPTGYLLLGDFSQVLVGMWGVVELLVNPYGATDFSKGNVKVRAILDADIAVRQAGAFAAKSAG